MNNPIEVARQYVYNKLVASAVLTGDPKFYIYPDWPRQGATYPLAFVVQATPHVITTVGTNKLDDNGLWHVNLVGDRDWNLSDLDAALNDILPLLHHTLGPTTKGQVSGCKVEGGIIQTPYQVGADWYPRYVIPVRVYAGGN